MSLEIFLKTLFYKIFGTSQNSTMFKIVIIIRHYSLTYGGYVVLLSCGGGERGGGRGRGKGGEGVGGGGRGRGGKSSSANVKLYM